MRRNVMSVRTMQRYEFRSIRLPGWTIPIVIIAALALIALAGFFSFILALLIVPLLLIGVVLNSTLRRIKWPTPSTEWPRHRNASKHGVPPIIEGEYEVVETANQAQKHNPGNNKPGQKGPG